MLKGQISAYHNYPWSLVPHIFHTGQASHGYDRLSFEVMSWT
jgi:hypothetical protein